MQRLNPTTLFCLGILLCSVLFSGRNLIADELAPRFLSQSQSPNSALTPNQRKPDLFQPVQSEQLQTRQNQVFNPSQNRPGLSAPNKITPYTRPITPREQSPDQSTGGIATTLVALTLIVLFILIAARLWKKHGPSIGGGLPEEILEPLGKRYLDQKQTIQLVRLGTRILVLGSNQDGMTTLAEITDPLEVDYLCGACRKNHEEQQGITNFNKLFQRAAKPNFDTNTVGTPAATSAQNDKQQDVHQRSSVSWPQSDATTVPLTRENGLA